MNEVEKALNERFLLQEEYLGSNKPINNILPLVSVTVATYQHVGYIKDCLQGILMQRTNFVYEIILGEDGSIDGTQKICKEYAEKYPDKIRLFIRDRKLSQYLKEDGSVTRFNGVWNRMSARGKYIAFCEGDDYWTDPLKLQKQVDFLESNPDYGLVYTKVKKYYEQKQKFSNVLFGGKKESFVQLLSGNTIPTLTTVFLKKYSDEFHAINIPERSNWKMGDYPLWLYIASKSKVKFLDLVTGVYRILEKSLSHSPNIEDEINFTKNVYIISEFFAKMGRIDMDKLLKERMMINILAAYLKFNKLNFDTALGCIREYKILTPKLLLILFLATFSQGKRYLKRRWDFS